MAPPPVPPRATSASSIQLLNLPPNGVVHQRVFLLIGRARSNEGNANANGPDGLLLVEPLTDGDASFAPHTWEINAGWFKALVPLRAGHNKLRLSCRSPDGRDLGDSTQLSLEYRETTAPRLRIVCLFSKDSPGLVNPSRPASDNQSVRPQESTNGGGARNLLKKTTDRFAKMRVTAETTERACIDCPPGAVRSHLLDHGRESIRRRLAIQGYMWQAWHAEQMHRHGFGHRTFALAERSEREATDTNGHIDLAELADIRYLVSDRSLKEFRDPNNAQQKQGASNGGAMHSFAGETIEKYVKSGQLRVDPGDALAVCIVDATWDCQMKLLRAHAAVGSFSGLSPKVGASYGVMGSHWLWAAPERLSDVTTAFMDTSKTDEQCCVNDLGEGKTASLTLNIGSGAMLHEAGHAMSNPHYPSGVMARGYTEYNRAFMTRENHSLRGNTNTSRKPITPNDDSHDFHIHRCQAVRALYHPLFSHPSDPPSAHLQNASDRLAWLEAEPLWKPTAKGPAVSCVAGLASVEIEVGDQFKTHVEWTDNGSTGATTGSKPPSSTLLTREYISQLLGFDPCSPSAPEVKITAVGCNLRSSPLDSYRRLGFAQSLTPRELPGVDLNAYGRSVRRGPQSRQDDAQDHGRFLFLLHTSFPAAWSPPTLVQIDIFAYDHAPTAIGFRYSNGQSQLLGNLPQGSNAPRDTLKLEQGETISHLAIRSGAWVDAVQVVLSSGRKSKLVGSAQGGGVRTLDAGDGEEIVGFTATTGAWMDSIGLLVADRV